MAGTRLARFFHQEVGREPHGRRGGRSQRPTFNSLKSGLLTRGVLLVSMAEENQSEREPDV